MSHGMESRLRKLEAATIPASRVVVVIGRSDAEHDAKIAELRASGGASSRDLFVCITRFSGAPLQEHRL
jgi:hypothetical protein